MSPIKRRGWLRWLLIALALFVLYQLASGPNGLIKVAQLRRENQDQQLKIDSLTIKLDELKSERQKLLTDSSYLEKLARRELGMSKPGEKVYRFIVPNQDSSALKRNF